jgi:hypothetical protein
MSQTEHTPLQRYNAPPVPGIEPVQGWQLCELVEFDRSGFRSTTYIASSADQDVVLNLSRFRFTPSQARFAFLVEHGFPASPNIGPWDDTDIEMRLAVPEVAA